MIKQKIKNLVKPRMKLANNTRLVSSLFILVAFLAAAGIIYGANTYYDIDADRVVVNEAQRVGGEDTNYAEFSINGDLTFAGDADTITKTDGPFTLDVTGQTLNVKSAAYNLYASDNITLHASNTATIALATDNGDMTFSTGTGDFNVNSGQFIIDGGGNITLNASSSIIDLDSSTIDLSNQATNFNIKDNTASAFTISQGSNNYFLITTTDGSEALAIDTPVSGGIINLGSSNIDKTINIGNGTATDEINIGTGGTSADDINIGDALADVDITGASQIIAGDGNPLTITANAASTWSMSSGLLTIQFDDESGFVLQNDATTPVRHLEISSDGTLTLRSANNKNIVLDPGTGKILLNADVAGDDIIKGVIPIFGFDLPAQTASSSNVVVSRIIENDPFASAPTSTTRKYKFIIRYADELDKASSTIWSFCPTSIATADCSETFTLPGSESTDLNKGNVYITDFLAPTTTPWRLTVKSDGTHHIRIYQIFLAAYDQVNDN